ncbi:hypothetical protein, partial [Streptomyces corchorusii]
MADGFTRSRLPSRLKVGNAATHLGIAVIVSEGMGLGFVVIAVPDDGVIVGAPEAVAVVSDDGVGVGAVPARGVGAVVVGAGGGGVVAEGGG